MTSKLMNPPKLSIQLVIRLSLRRLVGGLPLSPLAAGGGGADCDIVHEWRRRRQQLRVGVGFSLSTPNPHLTVVFDPQRLGAAKQT